MVEIQGVPRRGPPKSRRDKKPEAPLMTQRGDVVAFDALDEASFTCPPVWKFRGSVETDLPGSSRFRDHPDLPRVLEYKRIGEVVRLFQHDLRRGGAAVPVGRHDRDASPVLGVEILFDENEILPLVPKRERISEEACGAAGNDLECR